MKGVNKNVIEITDTGSDCFERAILFVRPGKAEDDGEDLRTRARQYIAGLKMRRRMLRNLRIGWAVAKYGTVLAAGAGITMLLLKI